MEDKGKQETLVKASGPDWTLVQPVGLTHGPATGERLADSGGTIRRQQMRRADVTNFLVPLLQDARYLRATVSLSG